MSHRGSLAAEKQSGVDFEVLVGNYGSSVSLFDFERARLTFSFDFDFFLNYLQLPPLAIQKVLSLVLIKSLLPKVRRVHARSRQAPDNIIRPADSNSEVSRQLGT